MSHQSVKRSVIRNGIRRTIRSLIFWLAGREIPFRPVNFFYVNLTFCILETLLIRLENYGKTTLELMKLRTIVRIATVSSGLVVRLFLVLFSSFFFLFLALALAFWIGEVLGSMYKGFLLIAGICCFGLGIVMLFRFRLRSYIQHVVIDAFNKVS